MATKAMNIKMDEERLADIKSVAAVFHMSITDVVMDALDEYLPKMKNDPFYRLTANVEEASEEETQEILGELESLSDDGRGWLKNQDFRMISNIQRQQRNFSGSMRTSEPSMRAR